MVPHPPRPRPQKRQNFQSGQRHKALPRWLQQAIQMPSPMLWDSQPNNHLNDMEMELEVIRRQRQMLQEKRQLLEEQAELERIQNQQQHVCPDLNAWDENPGRQVRRGKKRARPAPKNGHSKRSEACGYEDLPPQSMEQASEDVGPAQLPDQIFLGVDTASRSILGKMELCLGRVLKEIREQLEPRKIFFNPVQLRMLKQRLRERIHEMMMNKEVQESPEILKIYRSRYTGQDDERLVFEVMEVCSAAEVADPKSEPVALNTPKQSPRTERNKDKKQNRPNMQENREQQERVRLIKMKIRVLLENKMDGIFEKLVKLASGAAEGKGAKQQNGVTMESEPAGALVEPANVEAAPADVDATPAGVDAASNDEPVADMPESADNHTESKETPDVIIIDPKEDVKKLIEEEVWKALQYRIPLVLPRYKMFMIATLANDPVLKDLGLKAPDKLPELRKIKIYESLYHVKIVGKPWLPDRATMKQFLDQFNTVSIKCTRHKVVSNTLVVGVPSLEDRQRLLEHSGSIVGGKTLDIRISEKQEFKYPIMASYAPAAATSVKDYQGKSEPDKKVKGECEEVKLENAEYPLDSGINDLSQCISDTSVPQEAGASENLEETIEIPYNHGLESENGEVSDDAGEKMQNEVVNKNQDTEANGVVEIADD